MAVRQKIRMKVLDTLNNGTQNPLNGNSRVKLEVPLHQKYNPPSNPITGHQKIGTDQGFAGRPIRGLEKEFGKKYLPDVGLWINEPKGRLPSLTPDLMKVKDYRHMPTPVANFSTRKANAIFRRDGRHSQLLPNKPSDILRAAEVPIQNKMTPVKIQASADLYYKTPIPLSTKTIQ